MGQQMLGPNFDSVEHKKCPIGLISLACFSGKKKDPLGTCLLLSTRNKNKQIILKQKCLSVKPYDPMPYVTCCPSSHHVQCSTQFSPQCMSFSGSINWNKQSKGKASKRTHKNGFVPRWRPLFFFLLGPSSIPARKPPWPEIIIITSCELSSEKKTSVATLMFYTAACWL